MKPILILAFAATALAVSACQSMYVGGSVGTLADSGRTGHALSQTNPGSMP